MRVLRKIIQLGFIVLLLAVQLEAGTTKSPAKKTPAATKAVASKTTVAPKGAHVTKHVTVSASSGSLVTLTPTTLEETTRSAIEKLIVESESLHKHLNTLESQMAGSLPNLGTAGAHSTAAPPPPSPKHAINLNLLDDAVNKLNSLNKAVDIQPAKKPVEAPVKAPVTVKPPVDHKADLKLNLLDENILPPAHDPPMSTDDAPTLQDDETKDDMKMQPPAPNAAEGSSGSLADGDELVRQKKIVGASIGGSVAFVVLVCAVVAAVVISKRRKNSSNNTQEMNKGGDGCPEIKDYSDDLE